MNSLKIKIKAKTWNKDSYGLFDYENEDVNKQTFTITSQGILIREQDTIKFIPQKNDLYVNNPEQDYLISVYQHNGTGNIFNKTTQKVWTALSTKLGGAGKDLMNIKEGDIFKLGKIMFEVLKIKNYDEKKKELYYDSVLNSLKQYYREENQELLKKNTFDTEAATFQDKLVFEEKEPYKRICRFCLSDTIVMENPLLNLCRCDGSLKYVHLICLQNWLTNKLHLKKTDGILNVLWQGLSCELCKSQLPLSIESNGQTYDLIDFKNFYEENVPNPVNCLLLQSFAKNGKPSGLHFIDIGVKNQIRIGRGNECEIKLSDISVSRLHSIIKLENNKFVLRDNSSKFGTLFLYRKQVAISNNHIFMQCGRTLLEIYSSKKWFSNFPCINCEANVNGKRLDDEEQKN